MRAWLVVLGLTVGAWAAEPAPLLFRATYDGTLEAVGPHGVVKPLEVTGQVSYQPGRFGQALVVGGDGAQVKYPVTGQVRTSQGTVALWLKPLDWPAGEEAFHVFFETAGPGWLVLYKFWNGGLLFLSGLDHQHYSSAFWQPGNLSAGQWHHFAGTWAAGRLQVFLDGTKRQETTMPGLPRELQDWFRLGDDGWGKPHASHTLLDEARIYRWALPAEEIRKLAAGEDTTWRPNPPLTTTITPRPALGQWLVAADASGYVAPDGPGTRLTAQVLARERAVATAAAITFSDGAATLALPLDAVPAGHHTVRVTVTDAAGAEVARADTPFEKPADPPWWHNQVGLTDKVLPPYTPLRVADDRAACWGRTYRLNDLLPSQIDSGGQALLARPLHFSLTTAAATDTVLSAGGATLHGATPTRVAAAAQARAANLTVSSQQTLEYDGFYWTDVTLTPAAPTEVRDFTLHLPVRGEIAKLMHRIGPNWGDISAGTIPAAGYSSPGFQGMVWLGDEERGLAWFPESMRGWSTTAAKPVITVARTGEAVELAVHFINTPTTLSRPVTISFGLQATPVKPVPPAARAWRLGNLGTADNLKDRSMGNLQVIWPNGNLRAYGYPEPKDPAKFRQLVADLHAKGIKAIPYVNLNMQPTDIAEMRYCSADFVDPARNFSTGDVGEMGGPVVGACPSVAEYRDLIAWKFAKFVDEYQVDGIYIDCWNPALCIMADHGCGWHDAAGNLCGTAPIRGMREVLRRIREVLADRRPDFHIICHMSSTVTIPTLSFADSYLDGEQYQAPTADPTDDYLKIVPLDKWRTEHAGHNWGLAAFFLPEFGGAARQKPYATDRLMGLMLAHDASPWPIWCDPQPIFDAWQAGDRFGLTAAEFRPYWRPNGTTADRPDTLVSVYRRPGKVLLIVLNSGLEAATPKVALDAAQLGLKADWQARNGRDGTALARDGATLRVALPARGYAMVVVE